MKYEKVISPTVDKSLGYLYFMDKKHPLSSKTGRVYHHRHMASLKIGRWIKSNEHVHHIDGNRSNNDPDNLMIVSPKEHQIIECEVRGYKMRRIKDCAICNKETYNHMFCSSKCLGMSSRKIEWPSKEVLEKILNENTWVSAGKIFGVTDNAVRKWAKNYGLI